MRMRKWFAHLLLYFLSIIMWLDTKAILAT